MASEWRFQRRFSLFMAFLTIIPKAENLLHPNQKLATSLDLSWSDNLSAISAMNSELVGLPLVLLTV